MRVFAAVSAVLTSDTNLGCRLLVLCTFLWCSAEPPSLPLMSPPLLSASHFTMAVTNHEVVHVEAQDGSGNLKESEWEIVDGAAKSSASFGNGLNGLMVGAVPA